MECVEATDRETQLRLYEDLRRVVIDLKLDCVKISDGYREDTAQKERLITTLQTEIGALKNELLKRSQDSLQQVFRHNKEMADVRDQASREKEELMMRSQRELQDLKDSVREETERHKRETEALNGSLLDEKDVRDQASREKGELMMTSQRQDQNLKDSVQEETQRHERETEVLKASLLEAKESRHIGNTDDSEALLEEKEKHARETKDLKTLMDEREGLIGRYKRQTEESKASFLLEKAVIDDRHTQEMASNTSEIMAAAFQQIGIRKTKPLYSVLRESKPWY